MILKHKYIERLRKKIEIEIEEKTVPFIRKEMISELGTKSCYI